jgi:hypothetical protein
MKKLSSSKKSKASSVVLGRSAATGKLVLNPASKAGAVTMQAANTAVKVVLHNREHAG